jgi:hypothetical protein
MFNVRVATLAYRPALLTIGSGIDISRHVLFLGCCTNVNPVHSINAADQCTVDTLSAVLDKSR